MDKNNFPSLQRDKESHNTEEGQTIFQNTAIDPYISSQYVMQSNVKYPKERVNRNSQNISKKSYVTNLSSKSKPQNNNFVGSVKAIDSKSSVGTGVGETQMVPMGYFEHQSYSNNGLNSTARQPDNSMLSNSILPKLNKTIRNETLYSIKSKTNSSPHARMMKSLQKISKKKPNPIPSTVNSFQDQDNLKKTKFDKNKQETSIKEFNSNKYYEITTIEEDEEASTQNLEHTQKSKMNRSQPSDHQKKNKRYESMDPELNTAEMNRENPLASK